MTNSPVNIAVASMWLQGPNVKNLRLESLGPELAQWSSLMRNHFLSILSRMTKAADEVQACSWPCRGKPTALRPVYFETLVFTCNESS